MCLGTGGSGRRTASDRGRASVFLRHPGPRSAYRSTCSSGSYHPVVRRFSGGPCECPARGDEDHSVHGPMGMARTRGRGPAPFRSAPSNGRPLEGNDCQGSDEGRRPFRCGGRSRNHGYSGSPVRRLETRRSSRADDGGARPEIVRPNGCGRRSAPLAGRKHRAAGRIESAATSPDRGRFQPRRDCSAHG